MKLYYAPGACSLASRIVLNEIGREATFEKVDLYAKVTETGRDFREINPLGYVPVIELDDGAHLRENNAILAYLASLDGGPLNPNGDPLERARLDEALGFLGTELHKAFGPLFAKPQGEARDAAIARVNTRLAAVEAQLSQGRDYLLGDEFSVADAYAFVILGWGRMFDVSYADYPNIAAFMARVGKRASVRDALQAEGLLEAA